LGHVDLDARSLRDVHLSVSRLLGRHRRSTSSAFGLSQSVW
jgi:hypothetical protein